MAEGNAVALAAISMATVMGTAVIWLAKYFAKQLSKDLREHTKAAQQQVAASEKQAVASTAAAAASEEQRAASNEVLTFMKKLNGKLPKLVEEKIEQATSEQ